MRLALAVLCVLLLSQGALAQKGRLEDALAFLERQVPAAMQQTGTPGLAIAVVDSEGIAFKKGYGVRRLGESAPVTTSTVFQIGSISKSFTSVLVAQAVQEGLLDWKDRVLEHVPDFQLFDPWVTREFQVADLMSQHSGLPSTAGDLLLFFGVDREHFIRVYRQIHPVSSFRTEFAYQNGLFLVAAKIVEQAFGESWEHLLRQRIFGPLGMNSTTASYEGYRTATNHAGFHQVIDGKVKALPKDWPYLGYVDMLGPAGGINSNVEDMALYLLARMTQDPTILNSQSAEFLQRPQTVMATGVYYCQGLVRTERSKNTMIWHNGETSGAKNIMAFFPEHEIGIVVLTNLRENSLPEWIAASFIDVYNGREPRGFKTKMPVRAVPPKPLRNQAVRDWDSYEGEFENPFYGHVGVVADSKGLTIRLGSETEVALKHHNGDVFWLQLPVVDQKADGFARFSFDSNGEVRSLTLDAFHPGEIGTFQVVK